MFAVVARERRPADKLLLCLSEHSLESEWIDDELEDTLAAEATLSEQRGESVSLVFPLVLDGYFAERWDHSNRAALEQRSMADFRNWYHDEARFECELEKLAGGLRIDPGSASAQPKPQ
jgi:hypothetical protein